MSTWDPRVAIEYLSEADSQMERLIQLAGEFTLVPRRGTIFDGLLKSIVYQQLSGKAAGTIHKRLLSQLPRSAAQRPRALCKLSDEAIRGAGVSRSKLLALRDLANRSVAGMLPERRQLSRLTDEQIVASLTEVRGVGRWTAQMILIFWLFRPDVLPVLDLGVRRGYSLVHGQGEMPTPQELENFGECWRPYRSVATWYLWRAVALWQQNEGEFW